MTNREALDQLDLYTELILEYIRGISPEAKLHYLMNICKPTGHYCNDVLGQPGAPLTHQNLLYLTINICLDIEEDMKSIGTLGIPTKTLMLYNDLKPILSTIISNR